MKLNFFNVLLICGLFVAGLASCTKGSKAGNDASLQLIPYPDSVTFNNDSLDISAGFNLTVQRITEDKKAWFTDYLQSADLPVSDGNKLILNLIVEDGSGEVPVSDEGYRLSVHRKGATITASSETGIFYGLQSLLQLSVDKTKIPLLDIQDEPRFSYRGLMIDCSRHFFPLDFLKKQINMMAHYKLNKFHWHLTDGPGWRIEIKKYPELTQIAAWRTDSLWKDWWATNPRKYVKEGTPGAYGGYYTQDQARELVKYAGERHIEIIPEIEMPGHSEEVLAVYPQLSCTGKPYTSSEFCIGNPETFVFLENVLSEIAALFPSKYIHIGGDEASTEHWKNCPKCQALMKKEGLKDEKELQSYLIKRIEKFLTSKGKRLIGWDEIMEGGLAPEATVMSWRGEEAGIKAAEAGHDVIMTPGKYCYFDQYQGFPDTQPEAIGGFLPIEKVYSYNPVPDSLTAETAKHILGVQANMWAEYIATQKHAEYMIWPRLLALAEVAWTKPENKSWDNFKTRVNHAIPYLQSKGFNPYTLSKQPFLETKTDKEQNAILVTLSSELYPVDIRYTTDGSQPSVASEIYTEPILVKDSALIVAQLYRGNAPVGNLVFKRVDYHKAIGKKVTYVSPFSPYYPAGGDEALVDGYVGGLTHGDGRWQGFNVPEMEFIVDLGKTHSLHTVNMNFMQNGNAWIWFPKQVFVEISQDGNTFVPLTKIATKIAKNAEGTLFEPFVWKGQASARYVRVKAVSNGTKGGWMFLDEVVIW
ncbi:MAG: family 20 glycosylhydrolase [Petrimonas sp.]|nr:family 20 glycosylhydrolase [Petrimonas sp.]